MVIYPLPQPNVFKGSSYALLAFFLMAVFGVLTKTAASQDSVFWVSFLSYLTGLLLMLPKVYKQGLLSLKTDYFSYHLGRVGFGLAASILYTVSLNYIPLVNATLLFNAAPLFIPALSIFMLKQTPSSFTWGAVVLGFIGILIIIKPSISLFEQPGNLVGLLSGICLAVAYVFIKMLSPTDPIERILFYFFFLATCIQVAFLPFLPDYPSWKAIFFSVLAGIAFFYAQMSLVKAYEYATAAEVGTFQYSSVVFVGLLDWIIWKQIPPPSDLIGVVLVMLAGLLIMKNSTPSKQIPFYSSLNKDQSP